MKKIILNFFLLIFLIFFSIIIILSTSGIETDKFNNIIIKKAAETRNVDLNLNKIKFKIDLKELSLFLETQRPKITYRDLIIPVKNIKVYIDFLSLIESKTKINKVSLVLEELDIVQLNKLSAIIKPSNFKSILNNKIKKGKLISTIEIFFTEKGTLKNFIAKGSAKDLEVELVNGFSFKKINLSFFADKNDILIKNIFGTLEDIKISEGDLKLNLENGVKINSNFESLIDFNEKTKSKYSNFLKKFEFPKNISNLSGNFNNNIFVKLDNTYKVKDYNYTISGKVENAKIEFNNSIKSIFLSEELEKIYFSDLQIKSIFKPKNITLNSEGRYSLDDANYLNIKLDHKFNDELAISNFDFDFENSIELDIINYKKNKDSVANISIELERKKNDFKINKFILNKEKDSIKILDLKFKKDTAWQ